VSFYYQVGAQRKGRLLRSNIVPVTLERTEFPGIRGLHGPQTDQANLPGYPGAFDGSIGSGGTWTDFAAFNSAGGGVNDGVYRVFGTHTSPATVTYKSGQQFWGDPANVPLLTFAAGTNPMFTDGGTAKPNAKFMNMRIVGFQAQIKARASAGVEVAYCDLSAEVGTGTGCVDAVQNVVSGAGPHIHHNYFHDTGTTSGPIGTYQARPSLGMVIEDNEFNNILGGDGWKAAVGSYGLVIRHNWCHNFTGSAAAHGIWLDFWNAGYVIEWNLIENLGTGIELEANPGRKGLNNAGGSWLLDAPFTDPANPGGIIRYNAIRYCRHVGIQIGGSSDLEVYGNRVYRVQTDEQLGIEAHINLLLTDHMFNPLPTDQGSDLKDNAISNNFVEVQPTIAGHQPKRAVNMQILGLESGPYASNTKLNNIDFNNYKMNRALTSGDLFGWPAASGINQPGVAKTWAQWQAIPEDANSTAVE
jgi:hypothetical protein